MTLMITVDAVAPSLFIVDPATNLILIEGTPGLDPPRITSVELGAIVAPFSKLTVKPTVYAAELSNLMIEDFQPLVRRTFANEKSSRWMLGADFSLVDCAYCPVLNVIEKAGFSLAGFPSASAYLNACRERPTWKEVPKLPGL